MQIDFGNIRVFIAPIETVSGASKRERERRCIQHLINEAFGEEKILSHNESGRPIIAGASISVSHSANWGALAVAPAAIPVGIDIEENETRAARVIKRVLCGPFSDMYLADNFALTAWTLLEAAFKCANPNQGLTLVDFALPSPAGGLIGKKIELTGQPHRSLEIVASQSLGSELPYMSLVMELQLGSQLEAKKSAELIHFVNLGGCKI